MRESLSLQEFCEQSVKIGKRSFHRGVLTSGLFSYVISIEHSGHASPLAPLCAAASSAALMSALRDRRRLAAFCLTTQSGLAGWFAARAETTNNLLFTAGLLAGTCAAQATLSWKAAALALAGWGVTELSGHRAKRIYGIMTFYSATR